jgi:hypothetical protein
MQTYGSVVAMEFRTRPSVDFKHIVEEFDTAFQMVDARSRSLSWDCDDIAIIDRDDLRVALGWLPANEADKRWHLIIAVGVPPQIEAESIDIGSLRYLASAIAERTQDYLPFSAVMHGEATQPISADLIDIVFELVRHDGPATDATVSRQSTPLQDEAGADAPETTMHDSGVTAFKEGTGSPTMKAGELFDQIQESLGVYITDPAEPTDARRLSIHGLALGMCVLAPPVGAGMLTYTLLRDMIRDDKDTVEGTPGGAATGQEAGA